MTKHIFILVAALGLLSSTPLGASDKASELLRLADQFRPTFDSFVTRVKLTNADEGKVIDEAEFEVSVKGDNSLVRFLSPRSKGQSVLMRGDDMWMFLPAVARPVRITPIQRLMGNVSNGDLARLRYAVDYGAVLAGATAIDGQVCDILELTARRKAATYQKIRYTVRRSDARPMSAEYFLTSGKAVKRATFEAPRGLGGRTILSRTVVTDTDRPRSVTTIELLSVVPKALADKIFNVARSDG